MSQDNASAQNPELEYVNNVLSLTRDQLGRAMNATTELEALVTFERKRNADLEAKVAELEEKLASVDSAKAKTATDK
jgi:BMFP domain-containing protein YqiC